MTNGDNTMSVIVGWKWHFFDNYDVIIQQQKVGNALNLEES